MRSDSRMRQISAYIESFILYFCYSNSSIFHVSFSLTFSLFIAFINKTLSFHLFSQLYVKTLILKDTVFFFALLLKYFKCVLATSNTIRLSLENDILMFYRKRDNSFFNIIFEKGKE